MEEKATEYVVHVDLETDLQDFTLHGFETRELAETKVIELLTQGWVSDVRITNEFQISVFYPLNKVRRIEVKPGDRLVAPKPSTSQKPTGKR